MTTVVPNNVENGEVIKKKIVRFTPDTLVRRENSIATTISKHIYEKDLGYTQYHVQVLYKGILWTVYKRYRDFEEFHRVLQLENATTTLPPLPKKRWFERQRWLNRFDESYSLNRRMALQDYLRCIARMPEIRDKSSVFREFLEFTPEATSAFEEEMAMGELFEHQYIYYEREGNGKLIEDRHHEPSIRNDTQLIMDDIDPEASDDGYVEDDEGEDRAIYSSHLEHIGSRVRKRDSILETSLSVEFDEDGNALQS